jgi:hypothetical protein
VFFLSNKLINANNSIMSLSCARWFRDVLERFCCNCVFPGCGGSAKMANPSEMSQVQRYYAKKVQHLRYLTSQENPMKNLQ